jgi:hypothetical protein
MAAFDAVGHLDVDFVSQGIQDGNGPAFHAHGVGKDVQHFDTRDFFRSRCSFRALLIS